MVKLIIYSSKSSSHIIHRILVKYNKKHTNFAGALFVTLLFAAILNIMRKTHPAMPSGAAKTAAFVFYFIELQQANVILRLYYCFVLKYGFLPPLPPPLSKEYYTLLAKDVYTLHALFH